MSFLTHSRESVFSETARKNGGSAETGRQGKSDMLQVAETAPKAKLLSKVNGEFITASPDKKAAEWLEGHIAKSQNEVTTQIVDLTPALARVLLNRNEGNRKISDTVAGYYSRDIQNGGWSFNGEPLIVSRDGHLNDGQHRCAAVIMANMPIKVVLVIGVERSTQTTVDQGKVRTVGDYLAMQGHTNVNQLGVAASFSIQFMSNGKLATGGPDRPTKTEILAFIVRNSGNPKEPDILVSVDACQRKGADAVGGRSMLGFIHWTLWKRSGRMNADQFLNALIEGANLPAKHPILYVRNRLINERGRLRRNDKAELIFKAWNAHRRNDPAQRFEISGGLLPKLER